MIIVGYQGIGKSSYGKDHKDGIDLESSNFFVNGKRDDNWYKVYANIAKHLSEQGFVVFVSSHKVLRDELREQGTVFTTVYPALYLKEKWLKKLECRYEETKKDKDYRAWQNAQLGYDEQIKDLMQEPDGYAIDSMYYDLGSIISNIKNRYDSRRNNK